MSTAKDLFIIALDPRFAEAVGQGDLSLALAGAELVDLIGTQAVALDGDRVVPGAPAGQQDGLLDEAAAALLRQAPYEEVQEWLWRRGRDLAAVYQRTLEADGALSPQRRGRLGLGAVRVEPVDSPARERAEGRLAVAEPVLCALASAIGIDPDGDGPDEGTDLGDGPVTTVLAAVNDAVMELEAVRQRRSIEAAAFANVWRVP
ncbi:GPP34 family phosphoprotein [Streptomyces bambusae]|uniref:GOLPH3/VPS74 family protein n=1 Tax=Streptomyces bambusae TaxID=1550616 RepID=UPI001CFFAE3B|nr:GPP34 family phosphoprotein [Streptomyces bambusae]MCB5169154.1 GPP34 family phosphoprotein [Streptomyces bambusae]